MRHTHDQHTRLYFLLCSAYDPDWPRLFIRPPVWHPDSCVNALTTCPDGEVETFGDRALQDFTTSHEFCASVENPLFILLSLGAFLVITAVKTPDSVRSCFQNETFE